MKINKIFVIFICIITAILHCFIFYLQWNSKPQRIQCVSTEAVAVEIAETICKDIYPQFDYTELVWRCFERKDGTWIVFCSSSNSANLLGGGYPEIHIKKDGQVVSIALQK